MCGIIGVFKKTGDANRDVANIFQEQIERGSKGFGTVLIKDQKIEKINRACEPALFIHDLLDKENLTNMIISHHRMPSSTDNLLSQTHPIYVSNKNLNFEYYVIHNGVISNEDDLKPEHEKLGYKYTTLITKEHPTYTYESFNDSESLAIELALFIERKKKTIDAKGSFAFITLQVNKKDKKVMNVFFGTNGSSPLKLMAKKGKEITLRSEGEGITIKRDILFYFNPANMKKLGERKMIYPEIKEPETKTQSKSFYRNIDDYDDYGRYYGRYNHRYNKDPELPYRASRNKVIGFKTEDDIPTEETEEDLLIEELRSGMDNFVDDVADEILENEIEISKFHEKKTKYTRKDISEWKKLANEKIEEFFNSMNDLLQSRLEEETIKTKDTKQFDKEVEKMFCNNQQK